MSFNTALRRAIEKSGLSAYTLALKSGVGSRSRLHAI